MHPVLHVPAFEDNYIWLIRGHSADQTAVVDPGDAAPVLAALERLNLTPAAILCTHHHGDHTGGIEELTQQFRGLPVYGPGDENIAGITHVLRGGDRLDLPALGLQFEILAVPGHTRGHIAYYGHGWLFCGDTLFSAGCGRLFEGTPQQMQASLSRLAALPPETQVYCTHEYTLANLAFAQAVEPANADIAAHMAQVHELRAQNAPSLPTTLAIERRINPFLRAGEAAVRSAAAAWAGAPLEDDVATFAALRRWKDDFRPPR